MTGRAQPLFRLPPRPALIDWLWAGAGAGLIFGLAELAIAIPNGSALPPSLAALVLGINAAVVALGSLVVGAILRSRSVRISRSGLVGAVVGPLLFAAVAGRSWSELTSGGLPEMIDFSGLMTAALFATGAGLAASRLADALEQRGVVCSALYVWGGVALPLAASERLAHAEWFSGQFGILVVLAGVLGAAAVAWASIEIAKRRKAHSPRPFSGSLLWLVVISIAAATAPISLPWLLYDRDVPAIGIGPPNFLIAAVPDADRAGPPRSSTTLAVTPTFEQLAFDGSSHEIVGPETRTLLTDTRKVAVVPQLSNAGYATAAILPGGIAPPELAAAEVDAQPGVRSLLGGSLRWLGVAPLLTGPARPLLRALGLDTETRDADQIAERANSWLLDWRMERSTVPFFLFVDFRNATPPLDGESLLERIDARLGDILEHLRMLEVEDSTLVVVLSEGSTRVGVRAQRPRALLRAPSNWPRSSWSIENGSISSGRLGDFLIEVSQRDVNLLVTSPDLP